MNTADVTMNVRATFMDLTELKFEVLENSFVSVEEFVQTRDGRLVIITVTIHYQKISHFLPHYTLLFTNF